MKRTLFWLGLAALLFAWQYGRTQRSSLPPPGDAPALHALERGDHSLQLQIPGAEMDFYSVHGSSAGEIRQALNQQNPVHHFDGYTSWQVRWHWPGYGEADCDLAAATLETHIRVRLPVWQPPLRPDARLLAQWNRYITALARHEQGHVQRAQAGIQQLQQVLQTSTCLEAEARLQAVLDTMHDADRRYDADTQHGVRDGARFP